MRASFPACRAFTSDEEGGLSLDARDGGNYISGCAGRGALIGSKSGISAGVLAAWIRPQPLTAELMRDLPDATIDAIYRTHYWLPVSADQLDAGVDLMVMDHGFNAGVAASARLLQHALSAPIDGCIDDRTFAALARVRQAQLIDLVDADAVHALQQALCVPADGVIGPRTFAALAAHDAVPLLLVAALRSLHCRFYRALPGFARFGADWLARADRRQVAAYRLILPPATPANA